VRKIQLLSNEEFLASKNYWNENFEVLFHKYNDDGTEWWKVKAKNGRMVSCSSNLMAHKIAFLGQEILDGVKEKERSIDHLQVIRKVRWLVKGGEKIERMET
jgi:hypothetical protein